MGAVEAAARVYVAVRRGNPNVWRYGFSFWDSIRSGAAAQAERDAAVSIAALGGADQTFAARDRLPPFESLEPQVTRIAGFDVHINTLGLRGADPPAARPPHGHQLLVLGGSFAWGWGLADEDTWVSQLSRRLARGEEPTDVVNGGRNGGTINWALIILLRLNHRLPFDEVLLLSTYNNRTLVAVEGRPTWMSAAEYYLYNSSLLFVMMEEKLSRLRNQTPDYQHRQAAVRLGPRALEEWRSLYRRRLDQIALVCREQQRRLWVGAEPQRFYDSRLDALQPGDPDLTAALLARVAAQKTLSQSELDWLLQGVQIEELRALVSRNEAMWLDTASVVMPEKDRWMMDEIHLNKDGSQQFAAYVARELERR